jgi:integrase
LRAILEAADKELRPVLAIQALSGARLTEVLRLNWSDIWRVPGQIEICASKSKTRSRHLAEICPTLSLWLEPNRKLRIAHFPSQNWLSDMDSNHD